jgi:AcrR family transcriptional regulator
VYHQAAGALVRGMASRLASRRPRRSAGERREDVVRAALPCFAADGYAASTVAIARHAGVSQPYLFQLFATKRELYLACIDDGTSRTRRTLARVVSAECAAGPERMVAALAAGLGADDRRFCAQLLGGAPPEARAAARGALRVVLCDAAALSGESRLDLLRAAAQLLATAVADALELGDEIG